MLDINGSTIKLTRGDSMKVLVTPYNQDGTEYVAQQGDTIRFALKRNYSDQTPLVEKNVPTNSYLLTLVPSDTKELPFGSYVYDVELTKSNGDVDTYIAEATFIIAREVD